MPPLPLDPDRVRGALLGAAVGDALGMPVESLSHQNVRTYYKGIKEYRDDKHRKDLQAGQWTSRTQRLFALAGALAAGADPARALDGLALRRTGTEDFPPDDFPTVLAACTAAPLAFLGDASALDDLSATLAAVDAAPEALVAAAGQVWAVRAMLRSRPETLDAEAFWTGLIGAAEAAESRFGADGRVSARLHGLAPELDAWPLDLQDLCNGTGRAADEAWPFACAMVARAPELLEGTLLPAINVGGDAPSIGALAGALVGALHGWNAFPTAWKDGLEDAARLTAEADRFYASLAPG